MRCPKCKLVLAEYHTVCPGCGRDLSTLSASFGPFYEPRPEAFGDGFPLEEPSEEILSEVPPEEGALQEVEEPGLDLPEVEDLLLLEEEDEIVPEDLMAEGEDFPEGPEEFWEPDALDDEDIEEFLPPELRKDRGK